MDPHPTLRKVMSTSECAYRSMITTQLARLLDIDSEFNFDHNHNNDNDNHSINDNQRSATVFGAPLTHEGICSISQLIEYISKPDQIIEEGIFRKAGVKSRQKELRSLIATGQTIDIDYRKFSVHDCCDLLKRFISELPQSILTNGLQKFFLQSLKLESEQKKLDTIRLLILLLPAPNRSFLFELLTLFDNVAKHSNQNRMSIENLATVFAPSIFHCQWSMSSKSLSSSSSSTTTTTMATNSSQNLSSNSVQNMLIANQESIQCLTMMIHNVRLIFEPPEQLIRDATVFISNHIRLQKRTLQSSGCENLVSVTNLSAIPAAKFCATTVQSYSAKDYTERQLAELYAQMQSMANESPSIQKKLKKFNHIKTGTPKTVLKRDKQQQELIKQSLKKSSSVKKSDKGLKSLFKKMMTPNSERKRSIKLSSSSVSSSTASSPIITPKNRSKISTPKHRRESMSPRSIIPIDEKLMAELPPTHVARNDSKLTIISKRKPSQTFHETKLPIAVTTFVSNEQQNKKKQHLPTPIRSCSNSIISSTRLSCRYSQTQIPSISDRIGKENHLNNNVRLPMKILSLPTPLRNNNNNNDDDTNYNDGENIRRKRVKYLTSVYEELIASKNSSSSSSSTTVKQPSSRIPIINRSLINNADSNEDLSEYVSLTTVYTKTPLIEHNRHLSSTSSSSSTTIPKIHQRTSNSMRLYSKHTRL
ncbi:uncharacterized protein LOC124497369 [Dermatophagoides farinae]|uniref:uncharacterized protein LOC124497369 n=1 Tax=Dermatophagoides farinae TaxID=6954 RepID=UPI003F5E38F8